MATENSFFSFLGFETNGLWGFQAGDDFPVWAPHVGAHFSQKRDITSYFLGKHSQTTSTELLMGSNFLPCNAAFWAPPPFLEDFFPLCKENLGLQGRCICINGCCVFPQSASGDLMIRNIQLRHSGKYVCMVKTEVDSVASAADLIVRGTALPQGHLFHFILYFRL